MKQYIDENYAGNSNFLILPFPMARPVKKTKSIIAILAVLVPSVEMSDM